MQLSFVIPAHNEEGYIQPTLDALFAAARAQPHPFEVIVVDDASTDRTAELAAAAGARVLPVALRNIGAVRNAGAHVASGDILFFVDADTLINAAVLAEALAELEQGAVGGGAAFEYAGALPLYVRLLLPRVQRHLRRKKVITGAFLFCRRSAFLEVGGFDERYLAAEEVHFGRALRKKGRMPFLSGTVITSGRKFDYVPWWKVIFVTVSIAQARACGRRRVKDRSKLGFWYDERPK